MDVDVRITRSVISAGSILKSVLSDDAGGIVVFIGTVRNSSRGLTKVTGIELEGAEELAKEDLLTISRKATSRFEVSKLAVRHRLGRIGVGEVIVVIAVSAPHRKDAFAACRYVIDELKKSTPIWKKEYGTSGSRWVEYEG